MRKQSIPGPLLSNKQLTMRGSGRGDEATLKTFCDHPNFDTNITPSMGLQQSVCLLVIFELVWRSRTSGGRVSSLSWISAGATKVAPY